MYAMYTRITIALKVLKINGVYYFSNCNDLMIYLAAATSSKHAA